MGLSAKLGLGIIGLMVIPLLIIEICWWQTDEYVTITVTGKERIVETSGSGENTSVSSKYLVFSDKETFENTDVLFLGKFDSSDIQGKLKVDSTYRVKVYGWRIPLFSTYRNIVEVNK